MNLGQACRRCRGSCSLIPGRGCFDDLPGDEIVVSPPSLIIEPPQLNPQARPFVPTVKIPELAHHRGKREGGEDLVSEYQIRSRNGRWAGQRGVGRLKTYVARPKYQAQTGRLLRKKLIISDHGLFSSYEGQQGAANKQDSWRFFKDAQGFGRLDAGLRASFNSSKPPQLYIYIFLNLTYSRWTSSLPSCLWSLRIFPSLPGSRLTIFYRDASSALLQLVN